MSDKKPNIHAGHRKRLRELAKVAGLETLPPHQILELFLSFVIPHKDVNPLAHKLIEEFGSLHAVFEAQPERLMEVDGIGEVAALFLSLCSQIPLVYQKNKIENKILLTSPSAVIRYLKSTIPVVGNEKFYLTYIDNKNELIKTESFGAGSVDNIQLNIKELVTKVLKHKIGGVIMCHTHPHGNANPSGEDIQFTRQFFMGLSSIGVPLLDHIILSAKDSFSFLNNGYIDEFKGMFKNMLYHSVQLKNIIKFNKD
ncbi:MAG: DNA repair protein RadC [Christensenellaceae bacterium]|jgi:DNA repair protein RadC|nr:DNA repair protein RadC [Christensenellaceae bacterium]